MPPVGCNSLLLKPVFLHLPKTNSLPLKNGWLEDDPASFWVSAYFQGRLLLVSGRVTG